MTVWILAQGPHKSFKQLNTAALQQALRTKMARRGASLIAIALGCFFASQAFVSPAKGRGKTTSHLHVAAQSSCMSEQGINNNNMAWFILDVMAQPHHKVDTKNSEPYPGAPEVDARVLGATFAGLAPLAVEQPANAYDSVVAMLQSWLIGGLDFTREVHRGTVGPVGVRIG